MELSPVRYARTPDGAEVAWAGMGSGPTLLMVNAWPYGCAIELARRVGEIRSLMEGLAAFRRVLVTDPRGTGHSPPPLPESADDMIADLWAVADASGSESVSLYGGAEFASVVLRAALVHPERVSSIVLLMPVLEPSAVQTTGAIDAIHDLARRDWGLYANTNASWHDVSAEDRAEWARVLIEVGSLEALEALRPIVLSLHAPANLETLAAPTLVLHSRRDRSIVPVEAAREVAARIPGARLITMERSLTRFTRTLDPIREFLLEVEPSDGEPAEEPAGEAPSDARLSPREVEVLRLVAEGRSNAAIAEALVISPNTVARHVKNILAKTGAANRAEAAVYASKRGLLT